MLFIEKNNDDGTVVLLSDGTQFEKGQIIWELKYLPGESRYTRVPLYKVLNTYKQSGKDFILTVPIHNEQPVMEINNIGKPKRR